GRDDEVIDWARQGIMKTSGWQTDQLYDLACEAYLRQEQPVEVLALRRAQHERTPASSTYRRLREAAESIDAWPLERDGARRALRERNRAGLIDALLSDGDDELAWQAATGTPDPELDENAWLKLAEARQRTHPTDALPIYWRLLDTSLQTADRRAYASAIRLLKRARDIASAAGQTPQFDARVLALREQHRRRPALIAMLDKAKFVRPEPPA
ncbi:MAG: hypothetical protein ACRDLR_02240, partial [Gaiellaceae bacterium]